MVATNLSGTGPALPWGAGNSPAPQRSEPMEEGVEVDGLASSFEGPALGARIEVLWELEHDDNDVVKKWWGARVDRKIEDSQEGTTWIIKYDAMDEFPEETCEVSFLSKRWLRDLSTDALMAWKLPEEEVDVESLEPIEEEVEEDAVVSMEQLAEMEHEMEQELGMPLEQAALQQLQESLPPDQQLEMVARFRTFVDHFKDQLKERLDAAEGGSYTVTSEDIHTILQSFKK